MQETAETLDTVVAAGWLLPAVFAVVARSLTAPRPDSGQDVS